MMSSSSGKIYNSISSSSEKSYYIMMSNSSGDAAAAVATPIYVDRSQEMTDKRVRASTKRTYASTEKALVKWLSSENPNDLQDGKPKVPMSKENVEKFVGSHLTKKDGTLKTKSSVGIMISAIKYMHGDFDMAEGANKRLRHLSSGHASSVADGKARGEIRQEEGKRPLGFAGYCLLCDTALKSGETTMHFYLVTLWNLMSRTEGVANLNYNFFQHEDDSIRIKVPRSKTDPEGKA